MKSFVSGALAAVVATSVLVLGGVGTALAGPTAAARWVPPHDTIVKVAGNAQDGYGIHHYDGSALYPPTDSEARAECLEYDTRLERVRCRTEVTTWYADLADMKVALRWANRAR